MTKHIVRLLAGWCCISVCASVVSAAEVLLVLSERTAGYNEAAVTFTMELSKRGVSTSDIASVATAESGANLVLDKYSAKVVVTLGTAALRQVLSAESRVPVVAALIPRASFERILQESGRRTLNNVFVLYLDQPFARQLDLLRLVLPNRHRIGVLWGPESVVQQPALLSAMHSKGLEMVPGVVSPNGALSGALQASLDGADALLAIPDARVYNATTVSNILLGTYRARVPVFAFSPAYVRAGALVSVHSTATQVGAQAAAMARQVLLGGTLPTGQYPTEFTVTVNERVARSLDLPADEAELTERLKQLERRP